MKRPSLRTRIRNRILLWMTRHPRMERIFYGHMSSIVNPTVTRQIITHYDGDSGHQTNLNTGNLGFGFIHWALILNIKPKRVLCVGSRKGFIPAICALACAENGIGRVDFVDAGYDRSDARHWSGIGWWKRVDPMKHFSVFDVNRRLTTYIMTTRDFAKRHRHAYEYVYIDGDHSYEGVRRDWKLFWPRLARGGLMVFHDVAVRHTEDLGDFGVWKFWQEITKQYAAITFPFPAESGLGIIQKP